MTVVANKGHRLRVWLLWGVAFGMVGLATCCLAAEPTPAVAVPPAETTSLLLAIFKVFGSLLVVVGLMFLLLYFIKRTGLGSGLGGSGSAITILETRMVAPKKYITIVEIAGHCLALGITDQAINLLTELGPEAKTLLENRPSSMNSGSAFARLLAKSMQSWQPKTTRDGGAAMRQTPEATEEST